MERLVLQLLESVLEHGSIVLLQDILANMDTITLIHAKDVCIVGGVVNTAET